MNDYIQDDIQICVDFNEEKKLLEEHFGEGGGTFSPFYEARIVYNHRKPHYLDLIIYYTSSEYLFEKFQFLQERGVNIFGGITTRPPQQAWDFPELLDFSNSKLINIEESNHWEHNKKPLILIIDNLDLLINDRYIGDGVFQLTENVFQHLNEYIDYGQLSNYDPSDSFIFSNKNREITFGKTQFILSFKHDYGDSKKFKFEINRDAFLTITDDSKILTDIELVEKGNLLCLLMSFYWQRTIDYFIATVRVNNVQNYLTHEKFKYSSHTVDESLEYDLKSRYPIVYDFLESLDYAKLAPCKSLLNDIVPRIIKAKYIDRISEFMLLYNIIEEVRNFCIDNPLNGNTLEIKEEFVFATDKKATDKFIKNKIKDIVEIVDPSECVDFVSKASSKVNFIKKTGLIDQFDSLVSYLGLNPETYGLDFKNLIKIRNEIYHGKKPNEDVLPYNGKMKMLINDLILNLIQ
jgi:hypothetical protein